MILWALPAGMSAIATAVVLVVLGKMTKELSGLRESVAGLTELRVDLDGLRTGVGATRQTFAQLTSR